MATLIYAPLNDLKSYIGKTVTGTTDDAALGDCLLAGSRAVDNFTKRRFWIDDAATARVYRTYGKLYRLDEGDLLLVDDIATATGLVVESWNGSSWTTVDSSTYELYPESDIGLGRPATGILFPNLSMSSYRKIRVTAKWGWPSVPAVVKQATLLHASRLWARRDAKTGPIMGDPELGLMRLPLYDPDFQTLLKPLRLVLVA